MGTTLSNGVYLPDEGERNCYAGLKVNWEILNQKVADIVALQLAIAGALHREIVASLPTTDIDPNTIYMILSGTSATENVYNEFMYVNNAWELIGTSATDLTNYYTKAEVDGLLVLKANASDLTSHTGDTTIHVTANDKAKWTNSANTHVLRLALSALTPSTSGNSFSNLDDSTALKVGDKVMDTAGVLFEVTAIDTQNSTFTIGTALVDLAQDSDVVHKSGNETVAGVKIFSDSPLIYNSDSSASIPQISLKNQKVVKSSTTETGAQLIYFVDKNNNALGQIEVRVVSNGTTSLNITSFGLDSNNQNISTGVQILRSPTTANFAPNADNAVTCGRPLSRWSKIYGTEYYYGSNNVEFSTKFVTTDTDQTISGNKTFSSNVNVYNSDSSTDTANIILKNSKAERGSTTNIGEQNIFFLDKDNAQIGNIKCEVDANGVSTLTLQSTNSSNSSSGIRLRRTSTGTFLQPVYNNGCNLGTTAYRWYDVQTSRVNGVEPSSLSLPSGNVNDFIDISSYFSNTGAGEENNYTASANGWIYLRLGDISGCQAGVYDANNNRMWGQSSTGSVEQLTIPILKGQTLSTQWNTGSTVNVAIARFIPCQGNV